MKLSLEEILENGLADYRLTGIRWVDDGQDVLVNLQPPSAEVGSSETLTLRFVWVTDLRVRLDFGQYMGTPLLYDATLSQLSRGRWSVALDFSPAPEGEVSFECNQIRIEAR